MSGEKAWTYFYVASRAGMRCGATARPQGSWDAFAQVVRDETWSLRPDMGDAVTVYVWRRPSLDPVVRGGAVEVPDDALSFDYVKEGSSRG